MQAIKVHERVTEAGINIPFECVKEFKGEEVEIIILPLTKLIESGRTKFTFYTSKKIKDFKREDAYHDRI